jgi:hypothetical protein
MVTDEYVDQEVSMRAAVGLAVVCACVMVVGVAAQQQVRLVASILDAEGQPPAELTIEDLRVMEDGEDATVTRVELVKRGVKVQIVVDNGLGLGQDGMLHLRNGVIGLIKSLPDGLEATLVTTAPQPRFLARPTTDRDQLLQAAGRLTPDTSPGRFIEGLDEALQRAERDRGEHVHVILMAATTAGERDPRSSDIQQIMARARLGHASLHLAILDSGSISSSGGVTQQEVGQAVTSMTGGRYEYIAAPGRLATLLPEMGAHLAEASVSLGNQFRITIERPAGKRGDLGRLTMRARGNYNVVSVAVQ